MNRPTHIWLLFAVCLAVLLAAMGWVSLTTASAARVAYGSRLLLTGRLSRGAAHTPVARAPVDVYVRPGGRATASRVAQVLSGPDGSVSYTVVPRVSAAYQLRYLGDAFSAMASRCSGAGVSSGSSLWGGMAAGTMYS